VSSGILGAFSADLDSQEFDLVLVTFSDFQPTTLELGQTNARNGFSTHKMGVYLVASLLDQFSSGLSPKVRAVSHKVRA